MASLVPPPRMPARPTAPTPSSRAATFGSDMALMEKPQPMGKLINLALTDLMLEHGEIVMMGEDIATQGRHLRRHPEAHPRASAATG